MSKDEISQEQSNLALPKFHIIHSDELSKGNFYPFSEVVQQGLDSAQMQFRSITERVTNVEAHLETLNADERDLKTAELYPLLSAKNEAENKLKGFSEHTLEERQALEKYLSKMGIRQVAHCANGTFAMIFDFTEDQILRVSIGDEREIEPEFLESYDVQYCTPFKIEIFPKLDFESLDLEVNNIVLQLTRAEAVQPLYLSLKQRGIFTMDITGNNNALMKDGTPINGDPGNGVMRVDLKKPEENWTAWDTKKMREIEEARLCPLPLNYSLPGTAGPWSQEDKRKWHQASVYPLIATGKVAGVLSDAALAEIEAGGPIEILRADGSVYTPPLPQEKNARADFITDFVSRVRAGDYPLPVLAEMLQVPGKSRPEETQGTEGSEKDSFTKKYGGKSPSGQTRPGP